MMRDAWNRVRWRWAGLKARVWWWWKKRQRAKLPKKVLEEVNVVRALARIAPLADLPRGLINATGCPVALALNFDAMVLGGRTLCGGELAAALEAAGWESEPMPESDYHRHVSMGRTQRFKNPAVVTEFVRAFDNGKYPQYLRGSEV